MNIVDHSKRHGFCYWIRRLKEQRLRPVNLGGGYTAVLDRTPAVAFHLVRVDTVTITSTRLEPLQTYMMQRIDYLNAITHGKKPATLLPIKVGAVVGSQLHPTDARLIRGP